MLKQVLAVAVFGFAAIGANAASNNPLDPSFERNIGVSFAPAAGDVDTGATRNPLNPSFYQGKVEIQGGTSTFDAVANNPLHPAFHRS